MPEITQTDRIIAIDSPLGPDVLLLRSFSGAEGMSRIFRMHLDLQSTNFNINFDDIVGQRVTVRIRMEDGEERFLNGYISRFAQHPVEGHLATYEAEMVPWLWFLTRTADCKIFQEKSIPDIISEVFDSFGFSDYELQLQGDHPPRTYCVQYRETAANFVMRLMEEEGIFFFFRHEESKHAMVIADSPSVHRPCPIQSEVRFEHTLGSGAEHLEDIIFEWRWEHHLRPGKYAVNAYNFETPSTSLLCTTNSTINQGGNQSYEVYDYPDEHRDRGRGDTVVRTRIEEEETPHEVVTGESDCRALAVGYKFELTDHDREDQNREYLVTSINYSAHTGSFIAGTQAQGASYSNSFSCIPSEIPYRPLRKTPKPVVEGVQSAVVVGPSGEEIYTDKYGRVKVQFHWDRIGEKNERSSCWIRVSQPWGGKNWGGMWIPRMGQEVLVDFLEGDPDRPIITGRVYNAEQTVPYELPANQTVSTMKSRSSKGGGASNFNELRFEDKKGEEQIFIHAEKDVDEIVKNDVREHVGNSRHLIVKKDQKEKVEENKHITIAGSQKEQIAKSKHLSVGGDHNVKVSGSSSLDSSMDYDVKTGMKTAVDSGMEIHLKAGMKVVIEAGVQISLVGPGGFVDIGPAGVTIQGTMVLINSGGSAGSGSGSAPTAPEAPEDPDVAQDGIGGGGPGGGTGGAGGGAGPGGGAGKGAGKGGPGKGAGKGDGKGAVKGDAGKAGESSQAPTGTGKSAGKVGESLQEPEDIGKGGGSQAPGSPGKSAGGSQAPTDTGKSAGESQAPTDAGKSGGSSQAPTDIGKGSGSQAPGGPGKSGADSQAPADMGKGSGGQTTFD